MSDESPATCAADCKDGSPCNAYPIKGSDKCRMHAGTTPDGSSHEANGNAEKHGLRAEADTWFTRHRDEVEDDVKLIVQSWIDNAPFGWDNHGNIRLLVECAIDEVRMQQADDYVDDEGIIVDHYDGTDPISERPIIEKKENPALLPKSRMKKDTVRVLKDLDIIGSDDSTDVNVNFKEEFFTGLKGAYDED